ncbi:thiol:disulfide interchange protein DsbA/DsbL [Wenzhouxiangella sp. XN79A]|uniref:thiol:disulfide interchange protein DsbA/DsbL n=1 Tax=Wenzhouxiangella sp. XN79A TaxID=2724193 RepID=UPI00144A9957|nr:thiol:disulfide interchange protein DsbA/DsbL [Wenzhouxiangella sp. XN79A]NKI35287.1 thiol:disulfide interchange protein DsbA/DsbL [Wenzhouxiangella sp. XN79A]
MTQVLRILAFAVLALGLMAASPARAQFQEGTHYERIDGPATADDDVIEVVEVFSYMCPHCRNFQPYVTPWEKDLPEGVTFRRVPVSFNRSWEPFARAYVTADVLDISDQSHDALFTAIHDERRPFRTIEDLAEFHSQFGVETAQFESTAESFPVEAAMRKSVADLGKWGVRSTPTLVIDGKWRVSPRRGGTFEEMLEVADYLIERERADAAPAEAADS